MFNIYVGNVAVGVTEDQLRTMFSQFGNVKSVKIIKDRLSGEHRGFAFVEMSSPDEGKQAIEALNGTEVGGQRLRINEARPREDRPPRRPFNSGGGQNRFSRY